MPDAMTHPSLPDMHAFKLGQLPQHEAAAVSRHLEICPACREALQSFEIHAAQVKVDASKPDPASVGTVPPMPSLGLAPTLSENAAPSFEMSAALPPELVNHPRYRIIRELGRGGMGVVYQAVQTLMDRSIAIKLISPGLLAQPDALPRFQTEAKAAAHP